MNPFRSDSAPYVATLLISALGWLLTTLHGEIRATAVLAYEVKVAPGQVTLEMSNLSSSAVIKNQLVSLVCPKAEPCILPTNPGKTPARYGVPRHVSPIGDFPKVGPSDATQLSATVTLPAGGRTRLITPYKGEATPEFYAYQTGDAQVQFVEARSLKALFIAHYGQLLGALLALLSVALGVWLIRNLFSIKTMEQKGETPPLRVVLRLDDSGAS